MYTKNTKIVCTLGPASDSITELENLVSSGMNVARLNFSHGTYEHHLKIIKNIRIVEKKTGKRIGIMQDLQGPKIRIGEMPDEGIEIKRGENVTFTTKNIKGTRKGNKAIIPIQYKNITKDVKKGDTLFIDDGLFEVKILKKDQTSLYCKVKVGGILKRHKGINCPSSSISAPAITTKDFKDLLWGIKNNVDFVALSFVKSEKDIIKLQKILSARHSKIKIIAKIERHEAIKNLKRIIKKTDAVMVARGDLGIEIPAEKVPIIQKLIIRIARKYGKPVITATQVLQSMVENAIATRAEVSDAANAVFDKTDAIMLSNESSVGKYPFKAARTLSKVAMEVEKEIQKHEEFIETENPKILSTLNATCLNACEMAINTNANKIIVYTEDGYTARQLARHRLYIPIITITPNIKTARELTLTWGINTVIIKKFKNSTSLIQELIKFLKKTNCVKKGEKGVIVCNASKKNGLISATTF